MSKLTPLEFFMESIKKGNYYIGDDMVKSYWDAKELEKDMVEESFNFLENVQSKIIKRDYNHNLTDQFFREIYGKE